MFRMILNSCLFQPLADAMVLRDTDNTQKGLRALITPLVNNKEIQRPSARDASWCSVNSKTLAVSYRILRAIRD
jgi:hypothetical protein